MEQKNSTESEENSKERTLFLWDCAPNLEDDCEENYEII